MDTKIYTHCKRCGRKLKNPDVQIRGYGDVCYAKVQKSGSKPLFQACQKDMESRLKRYAELLGNEM